MVFWHGGENSHFQQHAWRHFAFKHLPRCSGDRTLPPIEKITQKMTEEKKHRNTSKVSLLIYTMIFSVWRPQYFIPHITSQRCLVPVRRFARPSRSVHLGK